MSTVTSDYPPQSRSASRHSRRSIATAVFLICADAAVAAGSTLGANWLLRLSELRVFPAPPDPALVAWETSLIFLAPIVVCLSMWQQSAYAGTIPDKTCAALVASVQSWTYAAGLFGLLVAASVIPLQIAPAGWPAHALLPAEWMLLFFALGLAGTAFSRTVVSGTASIAQTAQAGKRERWAVIGDGISSALVVSWLEKANPAAAHSVTTIPFSRETCRDTVEQIRARGIRRVFVALSRHEPREAMPLLRGLSALPVAVRFVPNLSGIAELGYELGLEDGIPVLRVSDPPLSRPALAFKRLEDIVLSAILLLLTSPAMCIAAAAIKLETSGPVFFRQPRQGFNGETIHVLKLRTMRPEMEDRFATQQTRLNDPRLTRVGAFLRRHSLDELPQLFNVLLGDMSLVGPRPHAPGTTAAGLALHDAVENYAARHRMKPGITGWAQVHGWRGTLDSVEKAVRRVECDLYYIENWSILLDIRIILGTIALMIRDTNVY